MGKAIYGFQIWPVHSEGSSEPKYIKNFGEMGAWAYPLTARFFLVPTIIPGTGKATDFKFGQYIQSTHPNKRKPIKNFREKGVWAYPGTARFRVPLISQEREKLYEVQILHAHLWAQSEQRPIKNFGQSSHGRSQGLPKIFRAPIHRAHRAVIFAIALVVSYYL